MPKRWVSSSASSVHRFLLEVLADGEWHEIKDLVSLVGPKLHPGKAYRMAERQRVNSSGTGRTQVEKQERVRGTKEDAVLIGKRQIISQALHHMIKGGWIEVEYDNPSAQRKAFKRIRLAEGVEPVFDKHAYVDDGGTCKGCGLRQRARAHWMPK